MTSDAIAYRPAWRAVAAVLVAVSRGSLLVIVALLLFPDAWLGLGSRLGNPLRLIRTFAAFCLAPGIAAWTLRRAFAATVAIRDGRLTVELERQRIEVPCRAIDGVVPWSIPLPAGGVWLSLASGGWFPHGLQVADPVALADALADAGASEHIRRATCTPAAWYARSLGSAARRWHQPLLAFGLFALVPALPLFRLHQWLAYGGTFGEYYVFGLAAYLLGFSVYWATAVVYLVLYAAVLRAALEPVVLLAAWRAPARTPGVRRAVEALDRLLYYGGVPLFLLLIFFRS